MVYRLFKQSACVAQWQGIANQKLFRLLVSRIIQYYICVLITHSTCSFLFLFAVICISLKWIIRNFTTKYVYGFFFVCVLPVIHFSQIYMYIFVKVSDRWEVCVSVRFIHWVFIVSLLIWNNKPIFYFLKNFKKINHKYWCRFRMDKHNKLVLWILFARPKVERT